MDSRTDSELLELVGGGSEYAFRVLAARHLSRAHSVACRVLYSRVDAQEAVQDAFTKVWVNAKKFDSGRASFSTWFYRILTRTCVDMLRKRPPLHADLADMQEFLVDDGDGADVVIESRQESERVRRAVQGLSEQQRVAVVLCYFEDMTNSQAAEIMGLHIKALEGLLVRARRKLRVDLEGMI